jgi:hypothetical protein
LEIGDEHIEINDWWACRDHSWGVRPGIGVNEPATGSTTPLDESGFARAFLYFATTDWAGYVQYQERAGEDGYAGGIVRDRVAGVELTVENLDLTLSVYPGTRRFEHARLSIGLAAGRRLDVDVHPVGSAVAMKGLGISGGYQDARGPGAWRGEYAIERDRWDVSDFERIVYPDGSVDRHSHRMQPVRVTSNAGGRTGNGQGNMSLTLSGRLTRFGLDEASVSPA